MKYSSSTLAVSESCSSIHFTPTCALISPCTPTLSNTTYNLTHTLTLTLTYAPSLSSPGKTTQIPQLVFDAAIDNGTGADINLVVTQPRRISAISVAERIAQERVEIVGQTAGK